MAETWPACVCSTTVFMASAGKTQQLRAGTIWRHFPSYLEPGLGVEQSGPCWAVLQSAYLCLLHMALASSEPGNLKIVTLSIWRTAPEASIAVIKVEAVWSFVTQLSKLNRITSVLVTNNKSLRVKGTGQGPHLSTGRMLSSVQPFLKNCYSDMPIKKF